MADLIVSNITNNFSVTIVNKPNLGYNVVSITQPGLNINTTDIYRKDIRIRQPQRSIEPTKDDLIFTFNVNENYENYYEIYNWIKSYKISSYSLDSLLSNIIIIHYDLNKVPVKKITCSYAFPIAISSLDLTTNISTAEPIKFNSTFVVNDILIENF